MLRVIKKTIQYLLGKVGFTIVKKETLLKSSFQVRLINLYEKFYLYLDKSKTKNITSIIKYLSLSQSQTFQDLFVLDQFNFKMNGYFIEFGAANGKNLSNTYILEKEFGWNGVVSEPSKSRHKELEKNRDCNIDKRCVWSSTGEQLEFSEAINSDLSTINRFINSDNHKRKINKKYFVESISLNDLLDYHKAPSKIDYLSIDTEGSELEILQSFDFFRYLIEIITVEHNFTMQREKIFELLKSKGYKRIYTELSHQDDWYILEKK